MKDLVNWYGDSLPRVPCLWKKLRHCHHTNSLFIFHSLNQGSFPTASNPISNDRCISTLTLVDRSEKETVTFFAADASSWGFLTITQGLEVWPKDLDLLKPITFPITLTLQEGWGQDFVPGTDEAITHMARKLKKKKKGENQRKISLLKTTNPHPDLAASNNSIHMTHLFLLQAPRYMTKTNKGSPSIRTRTKDN